ncbi:MAG: phospholipase D-like domain-containing protein, partial [Pseudomonadota bacterium]|nr:phospholipase D-like domain-containing protein [Pseudomonadota bacterium]
MTVQATDFELRSLYRLVEALSPRVSIAAAAVALAGCSSLPTVTPDMGRGGNSVQLQAANGRILSPERSREIIAKAAQGKTTSDVLSRHLAVEEAVAEAPLTTGNRVALLENGPATYAAMLAAIAATTDSIHMETYILEEDEAGQRFADALLERRAAGVQVALMHDGAGTLGTSSAYWKRLTDGGIAVVEYNPVNPLKAKAGWEVNQRDHRKMLVVDGRTVIMGGINISAVYSGSAPGGSGPSRSKSKLPWRDTDLQLDGPVVAEFQRLFLDNWQSQKGPPLEPRNFYPTLPPQGDEIVRAIGSTPEDPFSLIYVTLLSAINSAEQEILLTNAYFV